MHLAGHKYTTAMLIQALIAVFGIFSLVLTDTGTFLFDHYLKREWKKEINNHRVANENKTKQ